MEFPPDHIEPLWAKVPEHLRSGLNAYLMDHYKPGDFLCSVLKNDLIGAYRRADMVSLVCLPDIIAYLLACAPAPSFGSNSNFDSWLKNVPTLQS